MILPSILYTKDSFTAHQMIGHNDLKNISRFVQKIDDISNHFSCNCLKEVYHSDRKNYFIKR